MDIRMDIYKHCGTWWEGGVLGYGFSKSDHPPNTSPEGLES